MKHKTAELEGGWLACAVAKADGKPLRLYGDEGPPQMLEWDPVTRWEDAGPIIEREKIAIVLGEYGEGEWEAWTGPITRDDFDDDGEGKGPTPLIAAMRAFVASKLGEEVELP